MRRLRIALTAFATSPLCVLGLVVVLSVGCGYCTPGTVQIWIFVLLNLMLCQSMNLLTGIAGQISLGHAAFYGTGAYTAAIASSRLGVPFPFDIPMGVAAACVAGLLVSFPAGRVRDVYLAMMTLAFGLIFREIVAQWDGLTGGAEGMSGIASVPLRSLRLFGVTLDLYGFFRILLVVTVALMLLLRNFVRSRYGRALFAIQTSEVAAGSLGIGRTRTKRDAYVLSAGIAGFAGAIYAHAVGYLGPESFDLSRSIEILVMTVVGGLGSLPGQTLSAIIFTFLPERLQVFAQYQFIAYGVILAFALTVLPRGLAGLIFRPPRFISRQSLARPQPPPASPLEATSGAVELALDDLGMAFGGLQALDGVTARFGGGRIYGLIGPNGSGKSTLVNVVGGIYRPTGGRVTYCGQDITGWRDDWVARVGLIRTFQDPRLVERFTVRENLLLGAHHRYRSPVWATILSLPGVAAEEACMLALADAIIGLAGLAEVADEPVAALPYGYRRLTEVGRALMAAPRGIMLDEPAAGLTDIECSKLAALITRMREAGMLVLLIEHHMDFVGALVDEVVVLDSGRTIFTGDYAGMHADPTVIEAYIGTKAMVEEALHA